MSAGVIAASYVASGLTGYAAAVAADNPVIWLKLDDASGNFIDSGSDGTAFTPMASINYRTSPLVTDGLYSAQASGSGLCTRASCPASLNGNNTSIEAWISISSGNQRGMVAHIGTGAEGYGFGLGDGTNVDGGHPGRKLTVLVGAVGFFDSGYTFPAGAGTYHVVMTHTTTNNFVIYVNGTQVFSGTMGTVVTAGAGVSVGKLTGFSGYEIQLGTYFDHVAFYATALSSIRAAAHYAAGI